MATGAIVDNFVMYNGVKVMAGTRTYEFLQSKKPEDAKNAKRLSEFCRKAYDCGYELQAYTKLRNEFKDVV